VVTISSTFVALKLPSCQDPFAPSDVGLPCGADALFASAAGSFSPAGKKGGSALAMIPITADVGDVQAWEASVPVKIPSSIAGTTLGHLTVYLSNEDLEPLNLLADRWSAQLILSF